MVREPEESFLHKGGAHYPQTYEKTLNITYHHGNANPKPQGGITLYLSECQSSINQQINAEDVREGTSNTEEGL